MTTLELTLWLAFMLLGFAGSAFYSGLETGCYCLNRIRLHIRANQHDRRAIALRKLIEQPTVLLSTLLIGNNIANYIGTASLAVILSASGLSQAQQIVLNTLIITPLLFVFGETLPKDLFAAHADRLTYPLQRVLTVSRWLFTVTLLVPVVNLFAAGAMRVLGQQAGQRAFHPRRQVGELMKEGAGYGLLSDEQSRIVDRAMSVRGRTIGAAMTPWAKVLWIPADAPIKAARDLIMKTQRSRYPVVTNDGKVLGILCAIDLLVHEPDHTPPLRELITPAPALDRQTPLRQGLDRIRRAGTHIAIVADRHARPLGVVTPKDLIEPITGELPGW